MEKAQLGLAHSYSRAKVKFNVNKSDNMIIQAICLLDQLDKDLNTFAMRVREWYSWHFPVRRCLFAHMVVWKPKNPIAVAPSHRLHWHDVPGSGAGQVGEGQLCVRPRRPVHRRPCPIPR